MKEPWLFRIISVIFYHYFAFQQKITTFVVELLCIPETRNVYSDNRIQKFRYIHVRHIPAYQNIVKPIPPFPK